MFEFHKPIRPGSVPTAKKKQKQPFAMFFKIGALKNFAHSQKNNCVGVSF